MTATKLPFCGACIDGWICDPEDGRPVDRCECRRPKDVPTPVEAKNAATKAVGEAHPGQLAAALLVIRDVAQAMPFLSSNDTREAMGHAQIGGPVVGAAFARAVKTGLLESDGFVQSTDVGTHGHHVRLYASRIYKNGTA